VDPCVACPGRAEARLNVGIVKLSSLGDVVHTLPVASALRRAFPRARIVWRVEAREAALLREHPALDEVIVVDTRGWRRLLRAGTCGRLAAEVRQTRRHIRDARLDVVIDAQGLLKSALLVRWARADVRVGFAASWSKEPLAALATNCRVDPPASAVHVVDQYRALLQPLGVSDTSPVFHLPTSARAEARMDEVFAACALGARQGVVTLNPGAGKPAKRWPAEHFRALSRGLLERGMRVVIAWGPGELDLARAIHAGLPPGAILAPPTDLDDLLALLRRSALLVAGDTGPLHLAVALGIPTVAVFGPTSPDRNGPYGAPPGRVLRARDGRVESVVPEAALAAATAALAGEAVTA